VDEVDPEIPGVRARSQPRRRHGIFVHFDVVVGAPDEFLR